MIIVKIALLFLILVGLLRLKVPFTIAILSLCVLVWAGFGLNSPLIDIFALQTLNRSDPVSLIATVALILVFSELLSQSGMLKSLSDSVISYFGPNRITFVSLPALIGLLPMPGGALFSAPMLEGVTKDTDISAHKKTVINYWFRHIWEYAWPLYPGLILAAGLSSIDLSRMCFYLAPLTFLAVLSGMIFTLGNTKFKSERSTSRRLSNLLKMVYLIFPIILIILLFWIARIPMWLAMCSGTAWVISDSLISRKLKILGILRIIFLSVRTYKILLMVVAVLLFASFMQASNMMGDLIRFFKAGETDLPLMYSLGVIVLFPFIVGLLTGITLAFVGTTFPIILSTFIPGSQPILPYIVLAYASGLAGVMLSPTHLCLILSDKYFESSLRKVYFYLIPVVSVVLVGGVGLFLLYISIIY